MNFLLGGHFLWGRDRKPTGTTRPPGVAQSLKASYAHLPLLTLTLDSTDCVQILESQWLSQAGFPRQVYRKRTKNSSFHHPPAPINEPAPAESLSSLSSSLAYLHFTSENRPELGCSCPHTVAFPECLCPCIPPLGKQWQSTCLLWTSPNIPSLVWSHRKGQPAS